MKRVAYDFEMAVLALRFKCEAIGDLPYRNLLDGVTKESDAHKEDEVKYVVKDEVYSTLQGIIDQYERNGRVLSTQNFLKILAFKLAEMNELSSDLGEEGIFKFVATKRCGLASPVVLDSLTEGERMVMTGYFISLEDFNNRMINK